MYKNNIKNKTAFTLIELLVVISIIAILMSIMMPALGKARESAKKIQCRANVHQIQIACDMYATANKGKFPYRGAKANVPHLMHTTDTIGGQTITYSMDDMLFKPYLADMRDKVMFCPGKLMKYYYPNVNPNYVVKYISYQYFNLELYAADRPGIKRLASSQTIKGNDATWGCLTFIDANGKASSHDMVQEANALPFGMNSVLADGSANWYKWDAMGEFIRTGNTFYWPKQ